MSRNNFIKESPSLFLKANFEMYAQNMHTILLKDVQFLDNVSKNDLQITSSMIFAKRVANISMENVKFNNHHEISFGYFVYLNSAVFNSFSCTNDEDFSNNISFDSVSQGCLHFSEVKSCEFSDLNVRNKKI